MSQERKDQSPKLNRTIPGSSYRDPAILVELGFETQDSLPTSPILTIEFPSGRVFPLHVFDDGSLHVRVFSEIYVPYDNPKKTQGKAPGTYQTVFIVKESPENKIVLRYHDRTGELADMNHIFVPGNDTLDTSSI